MAKRPSLKLAMPRGQSAGSTEQRIDVLQKAMEEARPASEQASAPAPKKEQRNREGMKKATIHMSKEAHAELKIAAMRMGEGLEEFIIKALNDRLEKEDLDFRIV